jgi:hypothetical protein
MRFARAILALLAIVFIAYGSWSLTSSSRFQKCVTEQAAAETKSTHEKTPVVSLPVSDWAAIYNRCAGHVAYEYRDVLTALATVLIALFTLTLWLSTRSLWQVSDNTLRHAERTAEQQLRAYVFLDKIDLPKLHNPITRQAEHRISLAWKNTGHTYPELQLPGKPRRGWWSPGRFRLSRCRRGRTFHGLIGPQQSVNMPPIPISDDLWLHAAISDEMLFLIWGWAEYSDVFSASIHRTKFAFNVRAEGDVANPSNCLIRFEATRQHNATDEDCMRAPHFLA